MRWPLSAEPSDEIKLPLRENHRNCLSALAHKSFTGGNSLFTYSQKRKPSVQKSFSLFDYQRTSGKIIKPSDASYDILLWGVMHSAANEG